jgi:hypothetical protein
VFTGAEALALVMAVLDGHHDAGDPRLIGSAGNPFWYAEQLAALPAPYPDRGLPGAPGGRRAIGQRLLAVTGDPV